MNKECMDFTRTEQALRIDVLVRLHLAGKLPELSEAVQISILDVAKDRGVKICACDFLMNSARDIFFKGLAREGIPVWQVPRVVLPAVGKDTEGADVCLFLKSDTNSFGYTPYGLGHIIKTSRIKWLNDCAALRGVSDILVYAGLEGEFNEPQLCMLPWTEELGRLYASECFLDLVPIHAQMEEKPLEDALMFYAWLNAWCENETFGGEGDDWQTALFKFGRLERTLIRNLPWAIRVGEHAGECFAIPLTEEEAQFDILLHNHRNHMKTQGWEEIDVAFNEQYSSPAAVRKGGFILARDGHYAVLFIEHKEQWECRVALSESLDDAREALREHTRRGNERTRPKAA